MLGVDYNRFGELVFTLSLCFEHTQKNIPTSVNFRRKQCRSMGDFFFESR